MLGTAQLKTAIVRKLRAQFRTAAIPYIPNTWNTIIQGTPTVNTPYPYVAIEIDNNDIQEVAVTHRNTDTERQRDRNNVSRKQTSWSTNVLTLGRP